MDFSAQNPNIDASTLRCESELFFQSRDNLKFLTFSLGSVMKNKLAIRSYAVVNDNKIQKWI